ncbi:MAG: glutathionylspermidine synthase family protein [Saccharofermentanales bacterium]
MTDNMRELNDHYKKLIEDNFERNMTSSVQSLDYVKKSSARYHGGYIYSLYAPKIFPESAVRYLSDAVDTIYSILTKIIKEYIENEDYRKLFGFDERLESLILIDRQYDCFLPISRIDIFLNEDDLSFKFCEFNADGSSSMNEDRELNIALTKTAAYSDISKEYKLEPFELFDSWVKEFESIYSTYKKKVEKPYIAIVDFLEKGSSIEEFEQFRKSFEKAGYEAGICEIRDLDYKDNALYSSEGRKIDAIYRRAVTSDIMSDIASVPAFLEAVRDQNVCLIGSFCTQVIHNKIIFKILSDERTSRFLDEKERNYIKMHVPYTARLRRDECDIEEIVAEKEKWIIKPDDSYGAKGVFAGINFASDEWRKIIMENIDRNYMLQEFQTPYKTPNIDFRKKNPVFEQYSNLTGLYVYNGKLKGIYSRQSRTEIISDQYDENVIASVIVKDKSLST